MPKIYTLYTSWMFGIILIVASVATAEDGDCHGFGAATENCYPCYCVNDDVCDAEDGACANGCNPGAVMGDAYQGPYEDYGCQIGNVGYLQTASNGPLTFGGNTGNRAVDGNHDPDVSQSSCSHAMDDGTFGMVGEAWWTATLDADYVITGVIVTPSTGATRDYLSDTTIDVSTDLNEESSYLRCADIGTIDASSPNMTVTCTEPRKGSFVRLRRKQGANTASELVVCEVEVRGYLYKTCGDYKWGVACSESCNCKDACDDLTGYCPTECNLGWSGDNCQTATDGGGGGGGGSKNNIIIGVVVLIILLLIIVAIVAFFVLRRKNMLPGFLAKLGASGDPAAGVEDGDTGYSGVEETVLGTVSSRPIKTRDLADYIYAISHQPDGFKKEYTQVGAAAEADAGKGLSNGAMDDGGDYDTVKDKFNYIDASYLKGYPDRPKAFVISPAPVKGLTESLWRMAWDTSAACIISLMTPEELEEKSCWPSGGQTDFGAYKVKQDNTRVFIHCRSSDLTVTHKGDSRRCKYLQYTAWPSRVEPASAGSLLQFWRRARDYSVTSTAVSIVYSGSGLGRAGTYIALDYCLKQAESESKLDARAYAVYMRTLRQDMVLQLKQYKFLFTATHEHSQSVDALKSKKRDVEFKTLDKIKPVYSNQDIEDMSGNANPLAVVDETSSVDAVFVDGPQHGRQFITASFHHTPLEQNLEDFWQMMLNQKSTTLLVTTEMGEDNAKYWPNKSEAPLNVGKIQVQLERETSMKHYTIRDLNVSDKSGQSLRVRQFHSAAWPDYSKVPSSTDAMQQLVLEVHNWYTDSGRGPIVVACSTGYHQSGVVCAALYLLNMSPADRDTLGVFHAVKIMRLSRPEFIGNQGEYKFLYDLSTALAKR